MTLPSSPEMLVVSFILGVVASIGGGVIGGVVVGGKVLGNELAALLGGFYGPLAGVAGAFLGLAILTIVG
ncbi:hypothetical protein BSZ21_32540 [Bradyrhizobium canariense]|nr:hypothetical protein [Bradyrhizobium sp.]OSI61131.1 hypothetical protein BSZ21_32540 [Bradyrhizobium canariense]